MRIAIPVVGGKLSAHFGHCETFVLVDVDMAKRAVLSTDEVQAPPHQPGLLPGWLSERKADVIIAGGMGSRAQDLFADKNIRVIVGAPAESPETVVGRYLNGTLQAGGNLCDH